MTKHVDVWYEEDECLITLFCRCEECSIPLAEFNNGCKCLGAAQRKEHFIGGNGITQEEAQALLNELRSKK